MSKRQTFTEDVSYQDSQLVIDKANHVVRNVKVAGLLSKNKRRYLETALRGAIPLYQGAKVNVDHPELPTLGQRMKPRAFTDRFGRLENPRWTPTGIRADLNYNPKHEHAESFLWWAENDPSAIGLSHNILGVAYEHNGETIIEKIEEVKSVDLVADPATTQGLLEGNEVSFNLEDDDAPPGGPGGVAPGEGDPTGEGGEDEECDHLCNAATAIVKNKSLDKKTKLDKLRRLLGLIHDDEEKEGGKPPRTQNAGDSDPDEADAVAEEPPGQEKDKKGKKMSKPTVEESAYIDAKQLDALLDELQTLRTEKAQNDKRKRVMGMCQEAKLEDTPEVFLEALLPHDDETIGKLIADRKALLATSRSQKPVSYPPSTMTSEEQKKAARAQFDSIFKE